MKQNKKQEELQSRREFFKKAGKAALPILGAIALTQIPVIGNAASKNYDCNYGCTGTCAGSCTRSCYGNCYGDCTGTCKGSCGYSCSGRCSGGTTFVEYEPVGPRR